MSVEWEQRGANVTETGETVEATAFRIAFGEATAEKCSRTRCQSPKFGEARARRN